MGLLIILVAIISLVIWYAALREDRHRLLTVSFLDVGQGDAIFINAPSGRQVIIDGGRDSSVLRQLSRVIPWYDRSIDVLVATHPDADHISGLIDVLARYKIDMVVQSSVEGSTAMWDTLKREVSSEGAKVITAQRGQIIDLGKGAYLQILFPDRSVPRIEANTGCVVMKLVYGKTSFMLSCDAPSSIERYLVMLDGKELKSDVLKAGHHGSKTSSAPVFVGYVDPSYAVYSRGCDNSYGHPSKETIDTFIRFAIPTIDTCEEGPITFVSDAERVWRQ